MTILNRWQQINFHYICLHLLITIITVNAPISLTSSNSVYNVFIETCQTSRKCVRERNSRRLIFTSVAKQKRIFAASAFQFIICTFPKIIFCWNVIYFLTKTKGNRASPLFIA